MRSGEAQVPDFAGGIGVPLAKTGSTASLEEGDESGLGQAEVRCRASDIQVHV